MMHIKFQMYSCGSDRDMAIFILYSEETWVLITIKHLYVVLNGLPLPGYG